MRMQRREFLRIAAGAPLALTLGRAGAAPERRPNILMIMTDQQFAEAMSCVQGDQYLRTPAMDSLAAGGMLFTRAYSPNPLCVPARASMFSGFYPGQTKVQTNEKMKLDAEKFVCMGTIFKRAGYDTGFAGKWHMPWEAKKPELHGFDFVGGTQKDDGKTAEDAAGFIRRRRERPFLMVVSLLNPHNICEWSRGQELPSGPIGEAPPPEQCPPRRANHAPMAGETDSMILMRKSLQSAPMFPVGNFDEAKWRQYIWAYYRMIEKVDREAGKVLAALRESGQEENTLVVFTADHGDCQGAHGWNQKTVFYDESTRVPFIVSFKGRTKAGRSDRLVNTGVDLIPTMCDFAGVAAPAGLPGLSLRATAEGAAGDDPRQYVVTSHRMVQGAEVDGVKPVCNGRMVRSRRYKYCVYDIGTRRESLVDLERDPGETVNLAGKAEFAEELKRHRGYLKEWCAKVGDDFEVPEG